MHAKPLLAAKQRRRLGVVQWSASKATKMLLLVSNIYSRIQNIYIYVPRNVIANYIHMFHLQCKIFCFKIFKPMFLAIEAIETLW